MSILYRCLFIFSLFFWPLGLFADNDVGSVDAKVAQEDAACDNAPETSDKSVSRGVNVGTVVANCVGEDGDVKKSRQAPSDGPSGVLK